MCLGTNYLPFRVIRKAQAESAVCASELAGFGVAEHGGCVDD